MTLKRIFVALSVVFILCLTALPTFALGLSVGDEQSYDNYQIYNPSNTTGDMVYTPSNPDEWDSFSVRYRSKDSGVIGVTTQLMPYAIPDNPLFVFGSFKAHMPLNNEINPRLTFSVGQTQMYLSAGGTTAAMEYVGWTLKTISVGASGENTYITLNTYRTHSFTLDYPSVETYTLHNGDYVVDSNGNAVLDIYYTVDLRLREINLYLVQKNGIMNLDTLYYSGDFNFMNVRLGVYDFISADTYLELEDWHVSITDYYTGEAYLRGLEEGAQKGFDAGKKEGEYFGEAKGYRAGYDEGLKDGKLDVEVSEISIPSIFDTITTSTINLFKNIFGFEIFGINVSALIGSLSLISIVAWLIRKLVK